MAVTPQKNAGTDWARVFKIVAAFVLALPFLLLSAAGVIIGLYVAGTAIVGGEGLFQATYGFPYLIVGVVGGGACISLLQTIVKGRQIRHLKYHMIAIMLGLIPAILLLIAALASIGSQDGSFAAISSTLWIICLCLITIRQIKLLDSRADASAHHLQEEL